MSLSHRETVFEALGRHPIHPFPARMAPGIALEALGESKEPLRVLDPMAGSGTVLAVARSRGHRAFGVDLDPLAVLLSRVWTAAVDAEDILDKAAEVLDRARERFSGIREGEAYPTDADSETREFVRYWFDPYARRQLAALSRSIRGIQDPRTRDVLWCGFSRLIISKQSGASLALDLSHSRPHRHFRTAPAKPFGGFKKAVEGVVLNCPQRGERGIGPGANVVQGDARDLPHDSGSMDMVLTSPPYLNAIDYMRCSKFSLVWMNYRVDDLRRIRADSVGTEASSAAARDDAEVQSIVEHLSLRPKLEDRHAALLSTYVYDMRKALAEAARVLRPGGKAVYVVGDSTIRGTFVRNSEIVSAVARLAGLQQVRRKSRSLPPNRRYLPPPTSSKSGAALESRMRREVVLEFRRCSR